MTLSGKPNAIFTVLINSSQYCERNELIKTLKIFIDYMSGDKADIERLIHSVRGKLNFRERSSVGRVIYYIVMKPLIALAEV